MTEQKWREEISLAQWAQELRAAKIRFAHYPSTRIAYLMDVFRLACLKTSCGGDPFLHECLDEIRERIKQIEFYGALHVPPMQPEQPEPTGVAQDERERLAWELYNVRGNLKFVREQNDKLRQEFERVREERDRARAGVKQVMREKEALREEAEQLRVQLAGCSVAALGRNDAQNLAKRGDYGWSQSYQDVLDLRRKYELKCQESGNLKRDNRQYHRVLGW